MTTALLKLVSQYIKPKSQSQEYLNFNKKFKCPVCKDDADFCGISLNDSSINCHFSPHEDGEIVEIFGERYKVFVNQNNTRYRPISSLKSGQAVVPLHIVKDEINVENTHQFYSNLIKLLTIKAEHVLFSKQHWNIADPVGFGFRSNDCNTINEYIKQLSITNPSALDGVAGLTKNDFGNYEWILRSEGILIPSIQKYKISGFQMRNFGFRDDMNTTPASKYLNAGKNDFSLFNILSSDGNGLDSVLIAEGVKAIAGAQALNCSYALSLNGYMKGGSQKFWEQITLLKEEIVSVRRVFLALDHDKDAKTRKNVREEFKKIADQLILKGFEVFFVTWKGEAKGIDDAILAGQPLITTPHKSRKIVMNEKVAEQKYAQLFENYQKRQNSFPDLGTLRKEKTLEKPFLDLFYNPNFHSTVLNAMTGTGKTTASQIVFEPILLDENNHSRIGHFTPNHKIAEDYKKDLIKRNPDLEPHVMVYYGRNENNCIQSDFCHQALKMNQNVSKVVCATCELKDNGCKYRAQKEEAKNKKLVLFSHEQMGQIIPDSYKYDGGELITSEFGLFSHFIIDESPINKFSRQFNVDFTIMHDTRIKLEHRVNLEISTGDQKSVLANFIISEIADALSIIEKEIDDYKIACDQTATYDNPLPFQLTEGFKKFDPERIAKIIEFLKKETDRDGVFRLTEKAESTKNIPLVWLKMLFESLESFGKNWVYIHCYENTKGEAVFGIKIDMFQKNLVNAIFNKKVLILDGTAKESEWNAWKMKANNHSKFDFIKIDAKFNENVEVVLVNGLPLTNSGIKTDKNIKKIDDMISSIEELELPKNREIGAILLKDIEKKITNHHPNVKMEHFGKGHKASNEFVDTDVLIVSGYRENLSSLIQKFQMMKGRIVDTSKKKTIIQENIYTKEYIIKEVFDDDECMLFIEDHDQSDQEQAIQRLRLCADFKNKKTVYLIGDFTLYPDSFPPISRVASLDGLNKEESKLNGSLGGREKAKRFEKSFTEQIIPLLEERIGETLTNNNVRAFFATMRYKEREAFAQLIRNPHNNNKPIKVQTLDKYIANGAFLSNVEEVFNEMVKEEQAISKTSIEEAKKKIFTVENMVKVFQKAFETQLLREEVDKTLDHMESLTLNYKTAVNT